MSWKKALRPRFGLSLSNLGLTATGRSPWPHLRRLFSGSRLLSLLVFLVFILFPLASPRMTFAQSLGVCAPPSKPLGFPGARLPHRPDRRVSPGNPAPHHHLPVSTQVPVPPGTLPFPHRFFFFPCRKLPLWSRSTFRGLLNIIMTMPATSWSHGRCLLRKKRPRVLIIVKWLHQWPPCSHALRPVTLSSPLTLHSATRLALAKVVATLI